VKGISLAAKATGRFLQRNSPQILIGIAIAGVVTTAVMAAKATPAAIDALDEQLAEWPDNHDDGICHHSVHLLCTEASFLHTTPQSCKRHRSTHHMACKASDSNPSLKEGYMYRYIFRTCKI
jgi:hypothetical protein